MKGGRSYCKITGRPTIIWASCSRVAPAVGHCTDHRPVAQHGDAVADGKHLVQLVRDKNQCMPALRHLVEGLEQVLHLLRGQHGGWLVQDQQIRAAVEGFDNLHPLLLADRKLPDGRRAG